MTTQTAAAGSILGLKRGPGWFLAAGVLFIVVGMLALIEPLITSVAVGLFLGVSFMLAGAMAAGAGLMHMGQKGSWLYLALGLLATLTGLFMVFQPVAAALSLVWLIGVWLIFAGMLQLVAAFRAGRHRGWLIFIGLVDLLLGLVVIDIDPASAVQFLALIVAVSFTLRGIASIVYARELRKPSQP